VWQPRLRWIAAGCFLGFVAVLVMVATGTGIVSLDHRIIEALPPQHQGWFWGFADDLTAVVSPGVDGAVLLAVAAWLSWRRRSKAPIIAAAWAITVVVVVVLDLKYAVGRDSHGGFTAARGEFPSGHEAAAAILLTLAAQMALQGRRRRIGVAVVAALTALVGVCLVWDRFHYMSDVVGSLLLAPPVLAWVMLTPAARRAVETKPPAATPSDAE
jgi:membrane-associated phospholipid phosphatase